MFPKEKKIVNQICEIPVTLGDVSESIFGGINTKNVLLHRLVIPEGSNSDSYYFCEGLCKHVFLESGIVYPYASEAFSEKFTFLPSPYSFMLPYEFSDEGKKKEYNVISPEDLKSRFPMTYGRMLEFKSEFRHDFSPLSSADYSIKGKKFLEYFNTPKIIATEGYHLQAAYDAAGNHVFRGGSGIVLKDQAMYSYVTAVLNSPIARIFPLVCKSEMMYSNTATPEALKRFPILFPDNRVTEELIDTIFSYITFLKGQKYASYCMNPGWIRELTDFYEQILNLLVLDTYFVNDLDSRLLDALEENIHPYAGDLEFENNESLLGALSYIKQQIFETSSFGKYRLNTGIASLLSFSSEY